MKYKALANDKTWLPEGTGFHLLNGVPEGTPLVRPEFPKQLRIKELEDSVNKCKRMNKEDRRSWNLFIQSEKCYRQKWEEASEDLIKGQNQGSSYYQRKYQLTLASIQTQVLAAHCTASEELEKGQREFAVKNGFPQ